MRRARLSLLLVLFALACGTGAGADAGNGGDGGGGGRDRGPCGEPIEGADCWDDCHGFSAPICVDGRWDCEDDCEIGPCPEPATPGDVCGNGIPVRCEATEETAAGCPDVLCTSCVGLYPPGPVTFDGGRCVCRCTGEAVVCEAVGG